MHIKINKELYEYAKKDLLRDHDFAFERIGFFLAKIGKSENESDIILIYDYLNVEDNDYNHNKFVGASIGSTAIRKVLQKILDTGDIVFHVHVHDFPGVVELSITDIKSIPPLIKSFQNINPKKPHGIFLYGQNNNKAWVLSPSSNDLEIASKITVVGYPLYINNYD